MGRVFKRTRRTMTKFMNMRNGRAFYTGGPGNWTGPLVKLGRTAILATNSPPAAWGTPAGTLTVNEGMVLQVDNAEGHYQQLK